MDPDLAQRCASEWNRLNLQAAWVSAAGSAVGGLGALAAVVVALCGLRKWREDKKNEERSKTAALAIDALVRACDSLGLWASGLVQAAREADPSEGLGRVLQRTDNAFERGHEDLAAAIKQLRITSNSGQAHLKSPDLAALNSAYALYLEMNERYAGTNGGLRLAMKASGRCGEDHLAGMESYYDSCAHTIETVLVRGIETLGPIARYEQTRPSVAVRALRAVLRRPRNM